MQLGRQSADWAVLDSHVRGSECGKCGECGEYGCARTGARVSHLEFNVSVRHTDCVEVRDTPHHLARIPLCVGLAQVASTCHSCEHFCAVVVSSGVVVVGRCEMTLCH